MIVEPADVAAPEVVHIGKFDISMMSGYWLLMSCILFSSTEREPQEFEFEIQIVHPHLYLMPEFEEFSSDEFCKLQFHLIKLSAANDAWKIRVRVLRLWKQSYQIDMILMDENVWFISYS
ncbi:hypothetical protein E3N88_23067 [Mikania micrantha]|uniref:Uncharacterized protein n=1 Tax=Mikania micrantha TaxID=192012 RepID=A0A5N6NC86_9ASTR|nr:hypothetical protein E3N88_23067 [Mikania micrantha]